MLIRHDDLILPSNREGEDRTGREGWVESGREEEKMKVEGREEGRKGGREKGRKGGREEGRKAEEGLKWQLKSRSCQVGLSGNHTTFSKRPTTDLACQLLWTQLRTLKLHSSVTSGLAELLPETHLILWYISVRNSGGKSSPLLVLRWLRIHSCNEYHITQVTNHGLMCQTQEYNINTYTNTNTNDIN